MIGQSLRAMLPSTVGSAVLAIDHSLPPLLPTEAVMVASAVPARRREFAAGRAAARLAMAEAGFAPAAIPAGTDRAPRWPQGVSGSISHTRDIAAALAARCADWPSVGLDVEEARPMASDLMDLVVGAHDCGGGLPPPLAATLLFSAKEAAFKAQFPVTGRWLDHRDVALRIMPGSFHMDLCGVELSGSWRLTGRLFLTVMLITHAQHGALLKACDRG
nr:4'-phosphopantetheinyl transferase superfamily protein [Paracoccus saliphilus]